MEGISAERPDSDRSNFCVTHHNGILRTPFSIRPLPHRDEVHLRLERRAETVLPPFEGCENRHVPGVESVGSWIINVGELTFVHKYRVLTFANDEFCAHLDFVLITWKSVS